MSKAKTKFFEEMSHSNKLILLVIPFFIFILVIDLWLSTKESRYIETIRQHECQRDVCEADFDGDGRPGRLVIDRTIPPPIGYHAWLIVIDNEQEILRLPYWWLDGSFRTHIAIQNEDNRARLLVFAQTVEGVPISKVFAWDDRVMTQILPSDKDQSILLAMAAFDDAGSARCWTLYKVLRWPILIGCVLSFIVLIMRKFSSTYN